MSFSFYPYMVLPLTSLALSLIILGLVSRNLKTKSKQYFFVTVLILVLWNLGDLFYPGVDDYAIAKLILNFILVLVSMVPTFFGLSIVSLYTKPKIYEMAFLMMSMFIIPIILASPFELKSTEFGWQPIYSENVIFPVWITVLLITFLYVCVFMVKLISALDDEKSRKRVTYMLLGAMSGIAFGAVTVMISVVLELTPLPIGSMGLVFFVSFMFLAYFR